MPKASAKAVALGLAALLMPAAALAAPITRYGLELQTTGAINSLGAYEVGYAFRALTEGMKVIELGFYAIDPGVAVANLWAAGGGNLASVSVTANSVGWFFGTLAVPVDLVRNAVYYVTYDGLDVGYRLQAASGVSTSSDIAMVNGRYGDTRGGYPTHDYADVSLADIGYTIATPLPAALPLAIAGFAALGLIARRRA